MAVTVILCHISVSLSRGLANVIFPSSTLMLNCLSKSVCLSIKYLQKETREKTRNRPQYIIFPFSTGKCYLQYLQHSRHEYTYTVLLYIIFNTLFVCLRKLFCHGWQIPEIWQKWVNYLYLSRFRFTSKWLISEL